MCSYPPTPTCFYSSNPVQQAHRGTHAYMFTCTLISTGLCQHVTNQGYRWTRWTPACTWAYWVHVCVLLWPSVGLVGGEQRSVHRLHAGGAGKGPHQPVVYTVHVVDVHAGQEPDGVSINKVHHTNNAPAQENTDAAHLKFTIWVQKYAEWMQQTLHQLSFQKYLIQGNIRCFGSFASLLSEDDHFTLAVMLCTHSLIFFSEPSLPGSYTPFGRCWMSPIRWAMRTCSSSVSWVASRAWLGVGW